MYVPYLNKTGDSSVKKRGLEKIENPLELIKQYEMMAVELIDESDYDEKLNKNFNWKITNYTQFVMDI